MKLPKYFDYFDEDTGKSRAWFKILPTTAKDGCKEILCIKSKEPGNWCVGKKYELYNWTTTIMCPLKDKEVAEADFLATLKHMERYS